MSDTPFNWTCPYCARAVTISAENFSTSEHVLDISNNTGQQAIVSEFIICPNRECRKYTLRVRLYAARPNRFGHLAAFGSSLKSWRLVPWGASQNFPDYVPQQVRDDYKEACAIVDLSPKAASTLARRAVQGIVRDYWKIVKFILNLELKELATFVGQDITQETWDCIDVVRSVGNIGAHMEQDINIIVDVEPGEARLLIELIETLVADTYVARHGRQQHHAKLLMLKIKKQGEKEPATNSAVPPIDDIADEKPSS